MMKAREKLGFGRGLRVYGMLLLASWAWTQCAEERVGRLDHEGEIPLRIARLQEVRSGPEGEPLERGARRVDLAYRHFGDGDLHRSETRPASGGGTGGTGGSGSRSAEGPASAKAAAEPVLLLHGSPGSLQDFGALATRLSAGGRELIVPDMVGFGGSTRRVPDYSFEAQADYLMQLVDRLGLDRVHVVGFSWGGGVAIEMGDRWPERVASIVLVSALGVQEHELLGRHDLNHLVHAFQHGLFRGLDWLLPHFGLLGPSPLGVGFTRSFLDSDQRPLRAALESWNGPMLILHGRDDPLVPPAAAREHHRLVPQSRLRWMEGGHLVLWSHPEAVSEAILDWVEASARGALPGRDRAAPDRVAAAVPAFDRTAAGPQDGLGWLVFIVLVFVASMVSEDLTCAGVGLLVATGQVGFGGGVAACVGALVAGDLVLYLAGRGLGAPWLARLGRDPGELGRIGERLRRSAPAVVLLGRFIPGARLPTYVAAGVIRYPFLRFTALLMIAAALWAPLLVGLAAIGGRALDLGQPSSRAGIGLAVALIVSLGVAARLLPRLATHRGRRLLQSRWRRLRRWEFWPVWAIYLPLAPSILALAWRFRSLRAATLVNPSIPGGGLAGESKAAIQRALETMPEHAIATVVVEAGALERSLEQARGFMRDRDLDYPLVLKPDVGERGRGVRIVASEAEMRESLQSASGPMLIQEYIEGEEFGIFHVRLPGESRGRIFSLARKVPRFVLGNGRDPLERLILDDPVCLPMAETLLASNRDVLDRVPEAGESVQVSRIGTHSLGCRFLDGSDLWSEALERATDVLSRRAGLDFGRYDVRSPSEAALRAGELKVIEFNGLTAEAAHVYDPSHDLWAGLRILRRQWRHAFEIGSAHRAAGREPLRWATLATLVRESRS